MDVVRADGQDPGAADGAGVLETRLIDIGRERFARDVWGRAPLLTRRAGGFTVVKTAKPQQDMRFDVPTVGVLTLETMAAAGGKVLAIEAGRTILVDEPEFLKFADKHGIGVVALEGDGRPAAA